MLSPLKAPLSPELPLSVWELLKHYSQVCEAVCQAIRRSGQPQKVFYLELGMSRSTFDRRMRRQDWRPEELAVLLGLVEVGEVQRTTVRRAWWKWW